MLRIQQKLRRRRRKRMGWKKKYEKESKCG